MKFERELLKGVAPMAVLELLSREPMYGYLLCERLTASTGDILSLGRGSLYPLLYNLEAKGLVRSDDREAGNGRRRRYYAITDKGRMVLARQKAEWEQLQEGMNRLFDSAPHTVCVATR